MGRVVATVLIVGGVVGVLGAAPAGAEGELLYRRYCASCHGVTGAGDGPAAESLTPRPTDLRALVTSTDDLMRAIDGRRTIRAHGDAAMPVWGHVLEREKADRPHAGRTVLYEVQALAEYVRALRAPR